MRRRHTQVVRVTKLHAAAAQMRSAIALWFQGDDPVSVHTLLYAAHDLIHGMCRFRKLPKLFINNDSVVQLGIAPLIHNTANFFKHSRRPGEDNPDTSIAFPTEANLLFFSACITGLDQLGIERTHLERALLYYLLIHAPEYFPPSERKKRPTGETLRSVRSVPREEFLAFFIALTRPKRNR
jgi:hypothetical protein